MTASLVGAVLAGVGMGVLIRQNRRARRTAALLRGQTRLLEMIALGKPHGEVLEALCTLVERHVPGMLCSVLLLDGDRLRHGAAPSLPAEYCRAIDGITIGPTVGSCGTAAHARAPVVVTDIAHDPLWNDYRDVALAHDLAACWSFPILGGDGRCLGTFAMYYRRVRTPTRDDWRLIEVATDVATVALERHRTAIELARSTAHAAEESRLSSALAHVGHEMISSLDTPVLLDRLCQLATERLSCDLSATVLRDPTCGLFVARASDGCTPAQAEALRVLRLSESAVAPLLHALERDGDVQLRTDAVVEPAHARLLAEYGVTHSLYVALRRGRDVIGFLCAAHRGRTRPFTPLQRRLAAGIAQIGSMALANARLVEEVQRASQLKTEFVSTMSHELRTPLSVILGYADVLEDPALDADERRRTLGRVRRAGFELLEMIEATLDIGRLETGRDPARIEPVDVSAMLDDLAVEFAAVHQAPEPALHWRHDAGLVLDTDRRKLRMILKNLVANALKFTPRGEVRIEAAMHGNRCAFTVRDTGIGIAADRLPVIFEMFRQGDSSDARSYGGVGLGLYIVQRFLEQLGGDIAVASALDRGTAFTVTMPVRAALPLTA
ncbi:MAG: GAF domain-containing sensor histidine kinase [Deltaproteobacteria bacterium]|nr:GAF domain-containing sensor histidine kinase [Deltaproteobacteria bacterium]